MELFHLHIALDELVCAIGEILRAVLVIVLHILDIAF